MRTATLYAALMMFAVTPALAQSQDCSNNAAGFPQWLEGVKKDAAAQGIGARGLAALDGVTYDQNVISHDRGQKATFKQSFEEFSGRMVNDFRIKRGKQVIKKYQAVFDKAEADYGVQAPVFDCRRADKFRPELIDALKIVDEGDVPLPEMKGAWAGEIGQVQFLPSSYLQHAVDFDGDGRKDLVKSQADIIGSVAKFLADGGWQRDAGWDEGQPNFEALKSWNGSEVYRKTIALLADRIAAGQ
jgi:membrane-bound lytic murein transglycosylase B